ncbi:MAG TPA: hypothetical protein VLF63_00520, partial [Patescibacteria group bacterium]|nr:hypothetical protein [Patescibacteria group bacterium]
MTFKQRKALNYSVENGGNISKAMRDAGYSSKTAKNPKKLTESKAWQQSLDEYLTDDFLLSSLHDDIANNPGNRKLELELAFKLKNKINPKLADIDAKPVVFQI